jgi:hypothetical protein
LNLAFHLLYFIIVWLWNGAHELIVVRWGDGQTQAKRTVSTFDTRELCLSEPPFFSEVLVRKTKELGDWTVELCSQSLGHCVNEHCLSHDATVRKEIWLVGRHQYNSFVIHAKRELSIAMKRGDVFGERLALVQHRAIRVDGVTCNNSCQLLQVPTLVSFHD